MLWNLVEEAFSLSPQARFLLVHTISAAKKKDVAELLNNLFDASWKEDDKLSWYKQVCFDSPEGNEQDEEMSNVEECDCLESKVRAKKPSLTLNLGTNGLKVTSESPPMAGQAGRLQGQDRSAVTYPSSSHARRCLIWLSCDNRRTRYTAPLAVNWIPIPKIARCYDTLALNDQNLTAKWMDYRVRPRIERQDTNLRKAITAEQRLVATKNFCVSSRRDKYRRVFAARERKITSKDNPLSARSAGLVHTLAGWHGGRWHGTPKIKPILIAIVPCNARRA
ncbi:hypothetical protein J6590_075648 [Homalodisca vitripennis]|nr:hypothetical protein J6590_075648 [Homalodisca vitripennis]